MRERERKRNKLKKETKAAVIMVGLLLLLCVTVSAYRRSRIFDYKEHLDDVVITVDDSQTTLRQFGYYVFSLESFVNGQATLYDASNPLAYWNKHFRAGLESQFVSVMARDEAYDVCICDMIYEKMALGAGTVLTKEEEKKADEAADLIFENMTDEQRQVLGIDREMIRQIQRRRHLIGKFAKAYVKQIDFEGYSGYREQLISAGGAYYEENILPQHKVTVNGYIKNGLKFGRITVNRK